MTHDVTNTGRIKKALTPSARHILFERMGFDEALGDLSIMTDVDCAHLIMLANEGIIQRSKAARLVRAILALKAQSFAPLRDSPPLRGLYLLYEEYLIRTEGAEIGGILQTARSRNDLNATVLKLRIRTPYVILLRSLLRLQVSLLRAADRYAGAILPAYTHGQPAEPISFGHYLAGVAESIDRDIDAVLQVRYDLQTCPLGAGAVAGSFLPIDTRMTAEMLGFDLPLTNSINAVATRDSVYRLLASMAILGTTLSRIATDFLQWLTGEFNFLSLPDDLVGSSSAMPQKRNPFLLEHVQGRSAAALAALSHALSSTRSTPFSNCIAVGTEAVRPFWAAIEDTIDCVTLLRLVVAATTFNEERAYERAVEGGTMASSLAWYLVRTRDIDFRAAHKQVGELFRDLGLNPSKETLISRIRSDPAFQELSDHDFDPRLIMERMKFGGGAMTAQDQIVRLRNLLRERYANLRQLQNLWATADRCREAAVKRLLDSEYESPPERPAASGVGSGS